MLTRTANSSDWAFLCSSYIRSCRKYHDVKNYVYYQYFPEVAESRLRNGKVLIAYDTENPDNIPGFIIWENDTLHFLYVKHMFRNNGIATRLLEEAKRRNNITKTSIPNLKITKLTETLTFEGA